MLYEVLYIVQYVAWHLQLIVYYEATISINNFLDRVVSRKDRYAETVMSNSEFSVFLLWESIFVERQLPGIYFRRGRFLQNI